MTIFLYIIAAVGALIALEIILTFLFGDEIDVNTKDISNWIEGKSCFYPTISYSLFLVLRRKIREILYSSQVGRYIYYDNHVYKIDAYCDGYCKDCKLSITISGRVVRKFGGWIVYDDLKKNKDKARCIDVTAKENYQIIDDSKQAKRVGGLINSI